METRDEVVNFVTRWSLKTQIPIRHFLRVLNIFPNRFYAWKNRQGLSNRHNGLLIKSHWLLEWERSAVIEYAKRHPDEGYRRLTFMMLDADVVAASPSSVYRVLKKANLLSPKEGQTSQKGTGFIQPNQPHEHWHIDIAHINIACTFYYLCSVLDGFSRYIVYHELRERMQESDIELILQRAVEKFPGVKPRIISDNGPQFIAYDFKDYIREIEMTHVKTSPHYPQSNGKLERYHRSLKSECIRQTPMVELSFAISQVESYVHYYNTERLHSAIGYITPRDKLQAREAEIFAIRQYKLAQARHLRLAAQNSVEENGASLGLML